MRVIRALDPGQHVLAECKKMGMPFGITPVANHIAVLGLLTLSTEIHRRTIGSASLAITWDGDLGQYCSIMG